MTEYVEKATILSKCEEMWNNADETTQTGVDTINAIDRITDFIESLPSADVQAVKRGKWEICSDGYYPYCSNCKSEPESGKMTDYCPHCGAYMGKKK